MLKQSPDSEKKLKNKQVNNSNLIQFINLLKWEKKKVFSLKPS